VFFAVKMNQENEHRLASMSDDQVREMIHDRVGDKVDTDTESAIADKVVEKKEALAGSAATD
jgi:hypothetical protein